MLALAGAVNMTTIRLRLIGGFALLLMSMSCSGSADEALSPSLPDDVFSKGGAAKAAGRLPGAIGVALTPRHFPQHTDADIRDMFNLGTQVGSAAVFIYQWSEPGFVRTAGEVIRLSREAKLTPIVGLSPTSLDQGRKALDVPGHLRGGWFHKPSFKNREIQAAFVEAATELARLKPPYLCLATEINLLALQRMEEFLYFARTYKDAYRAAKGVSPETRVFVSFQYDFIRIVDHKEPAKVTEHAKVIDIFRPELDLIAISSYPFDYYKTPAAIPINYYSYLGRHTRPRDQVMIMEIGWPTEGKGNSKDQEAFVNRLPELLTELQPLATCWSLLHDVRVPSLGESLGTTGLLTSEGRVKPAFSAFARLGGAKTDAGHGASR